MGTRIDRNKMTKTSLHFPVQIALDNRQGIPAANSLRKFATSAVGTLPNGFDHKTVIECTIRIVGHDEALELNSNYRQKDYATNVLTFVYESNPKEKIFIGDIALCHPVLVKEAEQENKNLRHHYAHLVIHGLLHLQGWDHETQATYQAMTKVESHLMQQLGFPDPYKISANQKI
jgi:probable rRNA maturation factor